MLLHTSVTTTTSVLFGVCFI